MTFSIVRRAGSAVAVIAATLAVLSCTTKTSDRDLVLVNPIDAQELVQGQAKLLGLGGTATGTYVDPRSERDFRLGHIPGAISLPFQHLTNNKSKLDDYDVLIVYGDDYNDPKANAMSKRLLELGFSDVRTLRGGLRAWTSAGYALDTASDDP
ncbi:MAG: rhodanese-like domain-containing protein [Phycisphaerales bacterium]